MCPGCWTVSDWDWPIHREWKLCVSRSTESWKTKLNPINCWHSLLTRLFTCLLFQESCRQLFFFCSDGLFFSLLFTDFYENQFVWPRPAQTGGVLNELLTNIGKSKIEMLGMFPSQAYYVVSLRSRLCFSERYQDIHYQLLKLNQTVLIY